MLTTEERNALPPQAFALPEERGYPVPTVEELRKAGAPRPEVNGERHALNALQRSTQHGSDYEKAKVHELVKTRYPKVYESWKKSHHGPDPIVTVKKPNGQIIRRQYTSLGPAELYAEKQEEKGYEVDVRPTFGEKVGSAARSGASILGHGISNLAHRGGSESE
jgi:hypothetical protein